MADTNDDEWLYGSGGDNQATEQPEETTNEEVELVAAAKNPNIEKTFETFDEHNFEEAGDHEQLVAEDSKDGNEESQEGEEDDSDDDDDDDINVVIGDIKAGGTSAYVKGPQDGKQKQPGSKFNIEEFESVGTINGQPAFEFAIESIEDKPWRKPGADITDYFNYGFNEETWRAYCERQKRMRLHESGVGLASLTAAQNPTASNPNDTIRPNIHIGFKRSGPRPPKPHIGTIDVIGAPSQNNLIRPPAPRENVIQVMTADRREYSRTVVNQPQMPMQFNVPHEDFYHEEQDQFYGYEPTQDSQAWDNQGWAPSEIKELTPMNQPIQMQGPPAGMNIPPPMMGNNMRMPMIPPQNAPNMIPPLMGQMPQIPIKQEMMDDKRDNRGGRMGNRDFRDDSRSRHDDRKRMRERSNSPRDRDVRKTDRSRDERTRSDRDSRYSRETSSRRRSKSRDRTERSRRSKSRDKMRSKSRDRKADEKDRGRSDKSKRSKKEDS